MGMGRFRKLTVRRSRYVALTFEALKILYEFKESLLS
jgi:hypothetical protein